MDTVDIVDTVVNGPAVKIQKFVARLQVHHVHGWGAETVARQNVRRQNVRGQNVRKDKTSVGTKRPDGQNVRRTKRPWGQNVRQTKCPADKTSMGTKRPWGQNVRGDKTSMDKMSIWVIFTRALRGNIFY